MAIRNIRKEGDEILRVKCKTVREINDGIRRLIEDMFETMYATDGVGLAAPGKSESSDDRGNRRAATVESLH